ncbi:hypothetical protein F4678DRAFT_223038 [Xylaria arbuscula]|nr:hypothetical protein F4678DRAFT_223038 [Xylaria arbuscula]
MSNAHQIDRRYAPVPAEHNGTRSTQSRKLSVIGQNVPKSQTAPCAICPWKNCAENFNSQKSLMRHFQIHISCKEWCLLCGRFLTTASTFLRHKSTHNLDNATLSKKSYIISICNDLINQSRAELKRLQSLSAGSHSTVNASTTRKRALENDEILDPTPKRSRQLPDILNLPPVSATDKQSLQPPDQASFEQLYPMPAPGSADIYAPSLFFNTAFNSATSGSADIYAPSLFFDTTFIPVTPGSADMYAPSLFVDTTFIPVIPESADMYAPSLFVDTASIPADVLNAPWFGSIYTSYDYNTNDSHRV